MDEMKSKNIILSLQKKWSLQVLMAYLLLAFAITLLLSAIALNLLRLGWFIVPAIAFAVVFILFLFLVKRITEQDVVQFLNEAFPELQESSSLILKPYDSLNVLEKLQVKKVERQLNKDFPSPPLIKKKIKTFALVLVIAAILSTFLFMVPVASDLRSSDALASITNPVKPEIKLPQVKSVTIKITPPAYTAKGSRTQDRFNVSAEQGASLFWQINTNLPVKEVLLIFNDKSVLHLQPDKSHAAWSGRKTVTSAGFYQVKIAASLSELYQVEMIKDQPPVITVQSPKPNTLLEYGQPKRVAINVLLSDDYGIENTFINATTASGSGEAVKFKEQQIAFAHFSSGSKRYQLQKQLDLAALGMQPGDELYFYISATDNFHQQKRSDVYIVRLEDTAQLMSMDGLVSGVDLKPEFFRSERQIIIETEQLIKDRDTISVETFNKKSNDLGVDQKLLRLRYGKFLGEENENAIGEDHDHKPGEAAHDEAVFGNAEEILDKYSHKHDNAEDATFFDANTKKQLLATLTEMWNAELQLRTFKPKTALPFEYKALRLLKDLQQQTRAYVAKTGTKTTPLKPEIRLTGDLTKITQPVNEMTFEQKADPVTTLRKALGILELAKNREPLQRPAVEILEQAGRQLSAKAAAEPSAYLASLEALRRILKNSFKPKDISLAGSALQKMIRSVSNIPQQSKTAPDMKLSQRYFMNLNH